MQTNNRKPFPRRLLARAAFLLVLAAAGDLRALSFDTVRAVNVTPSQFDLFVRTSEPAGLRLEVYADAAGASNITAELGIEPDPVLTADPAQTTNYFRRALVRDIQSSAAARSLALLRVHDCLPRTTYYVRLVASNGTDTAVWPASGLSPVTTEYENRFVSESRQLVVEIDPSFVGDNPAGVFGLLEVAGCDYPLASVAGDGVVSNRIYFDLSDLFSAADHRNMLFTNDVACTVTLYAQPTTPDLTASFTVPYSNLVQVACAEFGRMLRNYIVLDIRSAFGQPQPSVGLHTNAWGTVVSCTVTDTNLVDGGTNRLLVGWTLSSDAGTTNGSGSSVTVTLTNSVVLTWRWKTRYWLDTSAGPNGQVETPDQWVDEGEVIVVAARPDVYYHVDRWEGDIDGGVQSNDTLPFTMDKARAVNVFFAENVTSNGVPQRWFAEQGLGTNDWETLGLLDQDHDGMLSWQEWVAGTSPTNPADVLKMDLQVRREGNSTLLVWHSVSNRIYKVWRSTDLTQGFRQVSGALRATPPVNTYSEPLMPAGQPVFYRISVERE